MADTDIFQSPRWYSQTEVNRIADGMMKVAEKYSEAVDEIIALRTRAEAAEKRCEELEEWAKQATTAISDAIGVGSEMFRCHGEKYRIDPTFVAEFIRIRRQDHHDAMHRNIRRIRDLEARLAALGGLE